MSVPVGVALEQGGTHEQSLEVVLSHELVALLSEQLYQSPIKAIEELVVNAYDADAPTCFVFVPAAKNPDELILVVDDGVGMDHAGLRDLWHVGHSSKRTEKIGLARQRKQIGKFGIGKLATYAVANRVTYVTRCAGGPVLSTTLDFSQFKPDPMGGRQPLVLPVSRISESSILDNATLTRALEAAGVVASDLVARESWTVVVLEELKSKARGLSSGRLRWVLSTAMPLRSEFNLHLNGEHIESAKYEYERIVDFAVCDLPAKRINAVSVSTREEWSVVGDKLISPSFPAGVSGQVIVTRKTIFGGKSSDLGRSHGFFVRVLGRLVNYEEPLFGLMPRSYEVFNRFRADVEVDDLDESLTAPRESVESVPQMESLKTLLEELYNEARSQYSAWQKAQESADKKKPEHERQPVSPRYLDEPIADMLSQETVRSDTWDDVTEPPAWSPGVDADDEWFYLRIAPDTDLDALIENIYSASSTPRLYTYEMLPGGQDGRLVKFDPVNASFEINSDHPLVRAHSDSAADPLLEDLVTAEALLEVYLREHGMRAQLVGEILERRDQLFRVLTKDRVYSFASIAAELRDAANDEKELEVQLVLAARALGFVAKHISGAGTPDGLARFLDYPTGEVKITLEAKSSDKVPSLGAIDFAGLGEHVTRTGSQGCLLVAPAYPGDNRGDNAAAALRAIQSNVSCWTVDQLARVVEQAGRRHLNARDILDIVLKSFTPDQVSAAVDKLLSTPNWQSRSLYFAIIEALRGLEDRLPGTPRSIEVVAVEVSRNAEFNKIRVEEVAKAVRDIAGASQGALSIRGDERLVLNTSIDELTLRVGGILGIASTIRRESTFRKNPGS